MTEIFDSVVKHGAQLRGHRFRDRPHERRLFPPADARHGPRAARDAGPARRAPDLRMPHSAESDAALQPAPIDGCAPDDFYSTSNHRTWVRHGGAWLEVERQRMDAAIVIEQGRATCRKLRDLCAGDPVVCFLDGIRVVPEFRERDRHGFAFMTGGISSERHVETSVERIADMIREVKHSGGRDGIRRRARGRAYRRRCVFLRSDPARLRGRAARRERAGRARYRRRAVWDVPRRQPEDRRTGRGRPSASHARDQRHSPRRRHPSGGRVGSSDLRRDVRMRDERCPVRPRRKHPGRRPAARYDHGSRRGAGPLRRGARRRRDGGGAVDDAARHRRRATCCPPG